MEKYQIVETAGEQNHAGSKATHDVSVVARMLGFRGIPVRMVTTREGVFAKLQRQIGYLRAWDGVQNVVPDGAVLLLQHPFHYPQLTRQHALFTLKERRRVKFICFVHDVEKLRGFRYDDYYAQEFEDMMRLYDVLIVHNNRMKQYFLDLKVPASRIVTLEIFDYLQKEDAARKPLPKFQRSITVAGNLDTQKCGYIKALPELEDVNIELYGPNFDQSLAEFPHIHYHGSFPADEVPDHLNSGFGLVWDGNSIDGCEGMSGQYLKYNNPHKLSLYLSSGLPVVTWNEAAEAEFVRAHGVGITLGSLRELGTYLDRLTDTEYQDMALRSRELASDLTHGKYTTKALKRAERILKEHSGS